MSYDTCDVNQNANIHMFEKGKLNSKLNLKSEIPSLGFPRTIWPLENQLFFLDLSFRVCKMRDLDLVISFNLKIL